MINTAGPSITDLEVKYVTDAVKNGWGSKCYDYIHKFEKEFAKYLGVKYALATSGGTGALWLGLAALNISKGDEVILPDLTYFACSDVIKHVGAKPVFVDIDFLTWCIDPKEVEKKITKRTKAIMPTDMYGNACDMDELKKFGIPIIEDACEAVGSLYKGKPVGRLADVSAFSFQGAKIMVTGVGGMFTTNNKELYERASFLNDHGEDKAHKFWQKEIGYEFEMSNIQAALGLAQLKRLPKLVEKKRQIFNWYHQRLSNTFQMNYESPNTKTNYWMSSIILSSDMNRKGFMEMLRLRNIDTRPFFYPISMFPIYKPHNTPYAHMISLSGINLPSGLQLTEKEVNYVCDQVLDIYRILNYEG